MGVDIVQTIARDATCELEGLLGRKKVGKGRGAGRLGRFVVLLDPNAHAPTRMSLLFSQEYFAAGVGRPLFLPDRAAENFEASSRAPS